MSDSKLAEKTIDVLEAVAAAGSISMPQIQLICGLPAATAHRIMQTLIARRFLMHIGRGEYRLGTAAKTLAENVTFDEILAPVARRHLRHLAQQVRNHVHLGVWNDPMVTYLVKQKFGKARLHSAEGTQLEGYCSALGKVLLSDLTPDQLDAYIADGNFISLTPATIVNPDQFRDEIELVRVRRWACDDEEFLPGLRCIAVPLTNPTGKVIAAISISTFPTKGVPTQVENFLPHLRATADAIAGQLFRSD